MTREEYINFANALKNNYTIDFEKLPEFCDMAISALSENKKEWIRTSEKMPKDGDFVLFCDIDGDIMLGYHCKGRPDTHFMQEGTYEEMKNVLAWQPLPEPYKEGGE